MACPASGTISISHIVAEFGGSYSMASNYRGGPYVTTNNGNVPTSGTISLSQFYSAVKYVPGSAAWGSPGVYYATVTATYMYATVIGGGGHGYAQTNGTFGGGGGSGGWYYATGFGVAYGATVTSVVGGSGGGASQVHTSDIGLRLNAGGGGSAPGNSGGGGGSPNGSAGLAGNPDDGVGRGGKGGNCTCPHDGVIGGGAGGAGGYNPSPAQGLAGSAYGGGGGGSINTNNQGLGAPGAVHIWW